MLDDADGAAGMGARSGGDVRVGADRVFPPISPALAALLGP
ncbi:MAG TPA: hypothetical protein VIU15_25100 [Streptomyces sp.]